MHLGQLQLCLDTHALWQLLIANDIAQGLSLGLMCCEDLPLGVVADNFDVEEATQIKFLRPVERHDGWRLGICCVQGSRDGVVWGGNGNGINLMGRRHLVSPRTRFRPILPELACEVILVRSSSHYNPVCLFRSVFVPYDFNIRGLCGIMTAVFTPQRNAVSSTTYCLPTHIGIC